MEGHAKNAKNNANCRTKQLNSYTKSQHNAMTTTNPKKKKKKWDLLEKLSKVCSQIVLKCLYLARIGWWTWYFMGSEQTCSCSYNMDHILWQTVRAFDLLHSSHMWIQARLLCGKHSTTMHIRIVSRFWFCRRPRRLKINIRWTLVQFWKSNICAKKQTSVSHSSTEAETVSLDADFRMDGIPALDLWDLVIEVFISSPNQINKSKDQESQRKKPVAEHHTPHEKPKSNPARQSE